MPQLLFYIIAILTIARTEFRKCAPTLILDSSYILFSLFCCRALLRGLVEYRRRSGGRTQSAPTAFRTVAQTIRGITHVLEPIQRSSMRSLAGEAMVYSTRKAASSVVKFQNVREVELESSLATDARQKMPQLLFYIIAILAIARTESPKSAQLLF